jgi:hypothetical protein
MDFDLISQGTHLTENVESEAQDIRGSQTRTFMCTLVITDQIEQESLDVAVWGSADGQNWGDMPLLKMPQRFYRGETRQVLDLNLRPEVNFIRAKSEVFRWGRGAPNATFVAGFHLSEVPAFKHAGGTAKVLVGS